MINSNNNSIINNSNNNNMINSSNNNNMINSNNNNMINSNNNNSIINNRINTNNNISKRKNKVFIFNFFPKMDRCQWEQQSCSRKLNAGLGRCTIVGFLNIIVALYLMSILRLDPTYQLRMKGNNNFRAVFRSRVHLEHCSMQVSLKEHCIMQVLVVEKEFTAVGGNVKILNSPYLPNVFFDLSNSIINKVCQYSKIVSLCLMVGFKSKRK